MTKWTDVILARSEPVPGYPKEQCHQCQRDVWVSPKHIKMAPKAPRLCLECLKTAAGDFDEFETFDTSTDSKKRYSRE